MLFYKSPQPLYLFLPHNPLMAQYIDPNFFASKEEDYVAPVECLTSDTPQSSCSCPDCFNLKSDPTTALATQTENFRPYEIAGDFSNINAQIPSNQLTSTNRNITGQDPTYWRGAHPVLSFVPPSTSSPLFPGVTAQQVAWPKTITSEPSTKRRSSMTFTPDPDPSKRPKATARTVTPPTAGSALSTPTSISEILVFNGAKSLPQELQAETSQPNPEDSESIFTTIGTAATPMLNRDPDRLVALLYETLSGPPSVKWKQLAHEHVLQECLAINSDRHTNYIRSLTSIACNDKDKNRYLTAYSENIHWLHPLLEVQDMENLILMLESSDFRKDGRAVTHSNATALMILALGGYCSSVDSTVLYTAAHLIWVELMGNKASNWAVPEHLLIATILKGIYQFLIGNICNARLYAKMAMQSLPSSATYPYSTTESGCSAIYATEYGKILYCSCVQILK